MSPAELAQARQARVTQVAAQAATAAVSVWQRFDPNNLDASWAQSAEQIVAQVTLAQSVAVSGADRFTGGLAASYGTGSPVETVPGALIGVDGAGRAVRGSLYGAVTTTKTATGAGMSIADAFHSGASYLATIMRTLVTDAARRSDSVSAAGRGYTHYVRVVSPGSCSRCAVLAGSSSARVAFSRHPACKCTACPTPDGRVPTGLHSSASDYFDSLSPAEQERVFTKSGAEAIRLGADPAQVVSARRGMRSAIGDSDSPRALRRSVLGYGPDGNPIEGYTTTEGTTRLGQFGRAQAQFGTGGRTRLMPESIMQVAHTPSEARVLLRDAGYLRTPGLSAAQRGEQAITDRDLADRLYRRAGYSLG